MLLLTKAPAEKKTLKGKVKEKPFVGKDHLRANVESVRVKLVIIRSYWFDNLVPSFSPPPTPTPSRSSPVPFPVPVRTNHLSTSRHHVSLFFRNVISPGPTSCSFCLDPDSVGAKNNCFGSGSVFASKLLLNS
jgi:hypothetical protein